MPDDYPWFRLYNEAISEPKLLVIANRLGLSKAALLGTWVTLLGLASAAPVRGSLVVADGIGYQVEDLAALLGLELETVEKILGQFTALKMIANKDGIIVICNWKKRQFESDISTERTRKFRKRNVPETFPKRSRNVPETPPESDTEESEEEEEEVTSPPASNPPPETENPKKFNVYAWYEQNIGALIPAIADKLRAAEQEYPPEWIIQAFDAAVANNARRWSYIEAILQRYARDGPDGDLKRRRNGGTETSKYASGIEQLRREGSQDG